MKITRHQLRRIIREALDDDYPESGDHFADLSGEQTRQAMARNRAQGIPSPKAQTQAREDAELRVDAEMRKHMAQWGDNNPDATPSETMAEFYRIMAELQGH